MAHRKLIPMFALLLVFGILSVSNHTSGEPLSHQVGTQIGRLLEETAADLRLQIGEREFVLHESLYAFYRERGHRPAWVDDRGSMPHVTPFLDVLRTAHQDGFAPSDYHLAEIEDLLQLKVDHLRYEIIFDPQRAAQLDLLLSDAFLKQAEHLTSGRVDPNIVHKGQWQARPRVTDVGKILSFSLENGRIVQALVDMIPPYRGYLLLRDNLARYRKIAEQGGWSPVPDGPLLRSGDEDPRVGGLRRRLWIEGDLVDYPLGAGSHFDEATAAALARFQKRHGLAPDRVLGPKTIEELNIPVEKRIRQIEVNLERWRWLPKDLGERYILVNIADFRLFVVEKGRTVMTMPVVVGTAYRETPVFSDHLTYLEFAPYWGVPPTILREDKLPKIRRDIKYLDEHHFEVISWQTGKPIAPESIDWHQTSEEDLPGLLRQKPGPWNPLGRVKFMFPNDFDVYLHDTPNRYQFEAGKRSFSSGCIRIERPLDLAQYLLENQKGWDCDALLNAVGASFPQKVMLKSPIPVHLLYWTAWVDGRGAVQFRSDLYGRDAQLETALYDASDNKSLASGPKTLEKHGG